MKPRTLGIVLAVASLLIVLAALWLRRTDAPPAVPPAPPEPAQDPDASPVPTASTLDARVFRSRDEVILLARRVGDGRPGAVAEVLVLDETGGICARGLTDFRGIFRARFEGEPKTVSLQKRDEPALVLPLPPPPPAAAPLRPLLADRSVLRPGDGFQVCAWNPDPSAGVPEARVRFEPPVPADDGPVEGSWGVESLDNRSAPRWQIFSVHVPADAAPGRVVVEIRGDALEIPIVPRFGPAPPAAAGSPEAGPAGDADPALRREDGAWRVDLGGPAEGTAVLVFAACGDRLLGHGTALTEGAEVLVPLPEDRAEGEVAITALVARPDGFREHRVVVPPPGPVLRVDPIPAGLLGHFGFRVGLAAHEGLAAPLLEEPAALALAVDDPSGGSFKPVLYHQSAVSHLDLFSWIPGGGSLFLRAVAIPRGGAPLRTQATLLPPEGSPPYRGPDWILEGDAPADPYSPGDARPAYVTARVFLPDGIPGRLPDLLARAPEATVSGTPIGATGPGALRLRAGDSIVLETEINRGSWPGVDTFEAGTVGALAGPLLVSSDAPGFRGLVLESSIPVDGATVIEDAAPGFSLVRSLPSRGGSGDEAEAFVLLRADRPFEGPVEVELPLPRGAVPAEDGWSIRARGPEGCRVSVEEPHVRWALPRLAAGETRLSVRIRLARRGRWVAPPAVARTEAPDGFLIRSAGAQLIIE